MATRTFEGARLDDVLGEVQEALGPSAAIVRADRRRTGGMFGFFTKERFVVEVRVPDEAPDAGSAGRSGLLELVESVSDADQAVLAGARTARSSASSTERPAFGSVLARLVQGDPVGAASPSARTAPDAIAEDRATRAAALVRLGLPELLVPAASDTGALVERLGLLPEARALPQRGGAVIALLGDRSAAMALAGELATELLLNPERIHLATTARGIATIPPERRIASVSAASALRAEARDADEPVIVVIDSPVGRAAVGWAANLLRVLEPGAVWAVVDAARKPEDVRVWAERVGGIDALAVRGLDETESPAAVLRAGIPVARLDGHPASALRWASLLNDRLATFERPLATLVA
jgi:hypothetical protein